MAWSCPKLDAATVEMISWIAGYCLASSSMTILNKAAIKAFNFPYWLCTFQNFATLLALAVIVNLVPKGHKIFGLRVQYSNQVLFTWTPAALLFCLMLVSAMSAMQTMSVTTVLVARSLTPLVTLILESRVLSALSTHPTAAHPWAARGQFRHAPSPRAKCPHLLMAASPSPSPSPSLARSLAPARALRVPLASPSDAWSNAGVKASVRIWFSLGTILVGSVFYCMAEMEGSTVGYIWLGVNLLAAAAYHVYVKKVINDLNMSTMDMVLYNNAMSIPLLIAAGVIADNTRDLPYGFTSMDGLAWLWVSLSLITASFISFTGFGMQAVISATSSTVVNHINKVASFIVAHVIFEDKINALMTIGMIITLGGTIWYSVERLMERRAAVAAAPAAGASEKTPLQSEKGGTKAGV